METLYHDFVFTNKVHLDPREFEIFLVSKHARALSFLLFRDVVMNSKKNEKVKPFLGVLLIELPNE